MLANKTKLSQKTKTKHDPTWKVLALTLKDELPYPEWGWPAAELVPFHKCSLFWSDGGSDSSRARWAAAHQETGHLGRAHRSGPFPAHRRDAYQLSQEQRVSTASCLSHTHTPTHTQSTCTCLADHLLCFVGPASWSRGPWWETISWNTWNTGRWRPGRVHLSSDQRLWSHNVALCAQILTIMDCMYPTSLAKGCCVIQEGDDGSTVYVLEGEKPTALTLCVMLSTPYRLWGGKQNTGTTATLVLDPEHLNGFICHWVLSAVWGHHSLLLEGCILLFKVPIWASYSQHA